MRTTLTIAVLGFALAMPAVAFTDTYHHYECTDGSSFDVAFVSETKAAYLQIDGKSLVLPKRFSLISQRYSFAMRAGGKAIMKHAGKTSQCEAK